LNPEKEKQTTAMSEHKWIMLRMDEDADFAKAILYDTSRVFDTEEQARLYIAESHPNFVEQTPNKWTGVYGWGDSRTYIGPSHLITLKQMQYICQ
jgi:hypothetical protein